MRAHCDEKHKITKKSQRKAQDHSFEEPHYFSVNIQLSSTSEYLEVALLIEH